MDNALKKLEANKRDRIINSALQAFAENGFKKASTNSIVKNAEISKGALFHYFGNKKELFNSLEQFVLTTVQHSIADNIDWTVGDFFERVKQVTTIKIELTNQYPYIYEFFKLMVKDKSPQEIVKMLGMEFVELSSKIYSYKIDFSLFKEGIDVEKAMEIIRWSMEKLGEEIWTNILSADKPLDINKLVEQTEVYYEVLKKAFYK